MGSCTYDGVEGQYWVLQFYCNCWYSRVSGAVFLFCRFYTSASLYRLCTTIPRAFLPLTLSFPLPLFSTLRLCLCVVSRAGRRCGVAVCCRFAGRRTPRGACCSARRTAAVCWRFVHRGVIRRAWHGGAVCCRFAHHGLCRSVRSDSHPNVGRGVAVHCRCGGRRIARHDEVVCSSRKKYAGPLIVAFADPAVPEIWRAIKCAEAELACSGAVSTPSAASANRHMGKLRRFK